MGHAWNHRDDNGTWLFRTCQPVPPPRHGEDRPEHQAAGAGSLCDGAAPKWICERDQRSWPCVWVGYEIRNKSQPMRKCSTNAKMLNPLQTLGNQSFSSGGCGIAARYPSNSHCGARLCAKHQPQRVHPPQTLRLVLWTQSRSDQNETSPNFCTRIAPMNLTGSWAELLNCCLFMRPS